MCIRDTKHFYTSAHRQLYDPCAERPRPLRLLFTSAHNAISFYFAPPSPVIVCVRITPPAAAREEGREARERKEEEKSRPFFNASSSSRKAKSSGFLSDILAHLYAKRARTLIPRTGGLCILFPAVFFDSRGGTKEKDYFSQFSWRNSITGIREKIFKEYLATGEDRGYKIESTVTSELFYIFFKSL